MVHLKITESVIGLFITQRSDKCMRGQMLYLPDVMSMHCMPVSKYLVYPINTYTDYVLTKFKTKNADVAMG